MIFSEKALCYSINKKRAQHNKILTVIKQYDHIWLSNIWTMSDWLRLFEKRFVCTKLCTCKTPEYYNEGSIGREVYYIPDLDNNRTLSMPTCQGYINYKCNCSASFEAVIRYFLPCLLYLNNRRTHLSNYGYIDIILLFGNDDYSYDVNSNFLGKVRSYINQYKNL